MTKDVFIAQATAQIKSRRQRAAAARELSAHIDDRVQWYTDCGYDEAASLEKALAQMGDPAAVGSELGKVHRKLPAVLWLPLYLIVFLIADACLRAYNDNYGTYHTHSAASWMLEWVFLNALLIALLVSLKKPERRLFSGVLLLIFGTFFFTWAGNNALQTTYGWWQTEVKLDLLRWLGSRCSSVIMQSWLLLSGNGRAAAPIMTSFLHNVSGVPLGAASLVLYLLVLCLLAAGTVLAFRLRAGHEKLSAHGKKRALMRFAVLLLAVLNTVNMVCAGLWIAGGYPKAAAFRGVYIVESDAPLTLHTLQTLPQDTVRYVDRFAYTETQTDTALTVYPDGTEHTFRQYEAPLSLTSINASYSEEGIFCDFTPEKAYVFVIPVYEQNLRVRLCDLFGIPLTDAHSHSELKADFHACRRYSAERETTAVLSFPETAYPLYTYTILIRAAGGAAHPAEKKSSAPKQAETTTRVTKVTG